MWWRRAAQQLAGALRSHARARFSILARLLMLAVLAVAPAMLDRIRLLEADRLELIAGGYAQATELARQGVALQQQVIVAARAVLQVVARAHTATLKSGDACNQLFSDIGLDVQWLKGLSAVDPDGRIVCSTFPNAIGLNLSDRYYFQRTIRTGEFVLSDYLFGRLQHAPTIVAVMPIRGANRVVTGMITAAIDLQWIGRLSDAVRDHPGSMAIVVDGKGTLLAGHPNLDGWLGRPLSGPLISAMLAQPEGKITAEGVDGKRRMFAYRQLTGTDAHLAVGMDEREVLGRVNRESWIGYVQLALICAAVLLGLWFGGERLIVQPIRSLARSAARIGLGNLGPHLTDRRWAPEFAPLAEALENMAHRLAAREEELRNANSHLEELASIDGLSGLANRRGFDANLAAEWRRAAANTSVLALIMIDVDHFKLFNDNHGHVEGDDCLRAVGEVITSIALEGSCFAARYGGQEFALLLPGTDATSARAVGERLRRAVADLRIVNRGAPSGFLTISIGVASVEPKPGDTTQDLVELADAALYQAKRGGRNAVVTHAPAELAEAAS
jgi:diguanylate cyclase (GGDEF)-like protein